MRNHVLCAILSFPLLIGCAASKADDGGLAEQQARARVTAAASGGEAVYEAHHTVQAGECFDKSGINVCRFGQSESEPERKPPR